MKADIDIGVGLELSIGLHNKTVVDIAIPISISCRGIRNIDLVTKSEIDAAIVFEYYGAV